MTESYACIVLRAENLTTLAELVEYHLEEGWELIGGITSINAEFEGENSYQLSPAVYYRTIYKEKLK